MDIKLEVTDYGTIKGDKDFSEIPINKFIGCIDDKLNSWGINLSKERSYYCLCETTVNNLENNYYHIHYNEKDYKLELDIKSKYYALLKEKLDMFSKITEDNKKTEEVANNIENGKLLEKHSNENDIKRYLKIIKITKSLLKKDLFKSFLLPVLLNAGNLSLWLSLTIYNCATTGFHIVVPIATITEVTFIGIVINAALMDTYKNISMQIHNYKINEYKLENTEYKLENIKQLNKKIDTKEENEDIQNNNHYNETIISYMDSITEDARKLKDKEKIAILNEIKKVLDEYISNMQQSNKDINLSLNNRNSYIYQTIEKLVVIEMKINEISKRYNNNKEIEDDSIGLKEKIDKYIELASENVFEQNTDDYMKTKSLTTNI